MNKQKNNLSRDQLLTPTLNGANSAFVTRSVEEESKSDHDLVSVQMERTSQYQIVEVTSYH